MRYDVKIVDCSKKLSLEKTLRNTYGLSAQQAGNIMNNIPGVIANNVGESDAYSIKQCLEKSGACIMLIPALNYYTPNRNLFLSKSEELSDLLSLYDALYEKEQCVARVMKTEAEITELELKNKNLINRIEKNRDIYNGKSYTVCKNTFSPDFSYFKIIFIVCAVLSTFISGILYNNYRISIFSSYLVLLVISALVGLAIPMVSELISYSKRSQREGTYNETAMRRAREFLNNMDEHRRQIENTQAAIAVKKEEVQTMKNSHLYSSNVHFNVPMLEELRNFEGVITIMKYIEDGRAYDVKEAINLYCAEVKEAERTEEIRKQTEYARQQAEAAGKTAINSEEALKLARENLEASRRAAEASEEAADYERRTYWENIMKR